MTTGLAIAALVVAVATAIAQYRQNHRHAQREAGLQERMADIEDARRRDELRPDLRLRYVRSRGEVDGSLEWVNDGPLDLDDVSFTMISRSGAGWRPLAGIRFVREMLTMETGSLGPMKVGEPVVHGIVRTPGSESDGGTTRFRMQCNARDQAWTFALECEIPPVE